LISNPYLFFTKSSKKHKSFFLMIHFICKLCDVLQFISLPDYCRLLQNNNNWLFLSTENSLHCQYCFFFISKNLLRALKQTTNLFKTTTLLSKLAFYDHLVFTKKQIKTLKPPQTKPYTCWKLNWTLSTTWRSKCQVVDVVWASLGFVHRVVEVTGVLFCSACSMFESLAIM